MVDDTPENDVIPLKELSDFKKQEDTPDGYDRLCKEIVAKGGNKMHKDNIARFLKFKGDKVVQELGFTEEEIRDHLKVVYLETIRDLKMPYAFAAKKLAELEVRLEKQRLLNRARGNEEELTEFDLKVLAAMNDSLRILDKLGFKEKQEMHVYHHFHDEVDGVLEGNWKVAHGDSKTVERKP